MDKDPKKEGRNIAKRGLSLDLAEQLDWTTALIWEDKREVNRRGASEGHPAWPPLADDGVL